MTLVAQFLNKYPEVSGYTLICVCEELNRMYRGTAGVDGIIKSALIHKPDGDHLARLCLSLQNQKTN